MGFDLSQIAINNLLEDFIKKPIKITIDGLSEKYTLKGTFQVFKKTKEGKDEDKHVPKSSEPDKGMDVTGLAKRSTRSSRIRTSRSR